ncbi:MAG: FkbM family methyltransferase [Luteolibacter sp.]
MKKIGNFWVPDIDAQQGSNLQLTKASFEDRGGIQIDNLINALKVIKRFDLAIDGGANVGSWTRVLADHFQQVVSFEPNHDAFECLQRNITEWQIADRVTAYKEAISDRHEMVCVAPAKQGRRTVTAQVIGPGDIPTKTIDDLQLTACSFIKLDLEGYEAKALAGATATVAKFRPWIMVENKKKHSFFKSSAEQILQKWGYQLIGKYGDRQIDWLYEPV